MLSLSEDLTMHNTQICAIYVLPKELCDLYFSIFIKLFMQNLLCAQAWARHHVDRHMQSNQKVYLFSIAAVINYQKCSGLKLFTFFILQFWKSEDKLRFHWTTLMGPTGLCPLLGVLGENPFLCCVQLLQAVHTLALDPFLPSSKPEILHLPLTLPAQSHFHLTSTRNGGLFLRTQVIRLNSPE